MSTGWAARCAKGAPPAWGTRLVTAVLAAALLCAVILTLGMASAQAQVPAAAQPYRLVLKRNAQMLWGLDAPVATFGAQVHQESRWRPDARSPVGALGLTQFMPATADWIGGLDPALAERAPTNPTWALRALVTYDRWLWQRVQAADACERMAFVLQAYNGGLGWVYKRQRLSPEPAVCLGATCRVNPGVSEASQREAEHYPEVILRRHEPLYALWGPRSCP